MGCAVDCQLCTVDGAGRGPSTGCKWNAFGAQVFVSETVDSGRYCSIVKLACIRNGGTARWGRGLVRDARGFDCVPAY